MLTIKRIKQVVEKFKPNNFGCTNYSVIYANRDFKISLPTVESFIDSGYYDLFLDRVIQGFNRVIKDFMIIYHAKTIEIIYMDKDKESYKIIRHEGTTEGIREAREKAIRFVLKEIGK